MFELLSIWQVNPINKHQGRFAKNQPKKYLNCDHKDPWNIRPPNTTKDHQPIWRNHITFEAYTHPQWTTFSHWSFSILHYIILYYIISNCFICLYYITWYCILLSYMLLSYIIWYCILLFVLLYYMILYFIIYYIILYIYMCVLLGNGWWNW